MCKAMQVLGLSKGVGEIHTKNLHISVDSLRYLKLTTAQ